MRSVNSDPNVISIAARSARRARGESSDPAIVERDDRSRSLERRTSAQVRPPRVADDAGAGRILQFKGPGRGTGNAEQADAPAPPSGDGSMSGLTVRRLAPALQGEAGSTTLREAQARSSRWSHRSFDPQMVGTLECAAWVAYYRRDWLTFLRSGVRVSRHVFGLSWKATIQCSWLILRANQLWAPFPNNDPERSRRMMERFYRIVQRLYAEPFDPATAADLEVQWWRVHRDTQHSQAGDAGPGLADALARLYSHMYGVSEQSVRRAAEQRALAMQYSDQWIREGCRLDSTLIDHERTALIRSYAELLTAVEAPQRPVPSRSGTGRT